jgi:hypothetical protein
LPRKAAQLGLGIPGEIDVLAADTRRNRIYVVEAEFPQQPFSPPEIAFHLAARQG